MDDRGRRHLATDIVRISQGTSNQISGVVVRLPTGERFAFEGLDRLTELLRERVTADLAEPP